MRWVGLFALAACGRLGFDPFAPATGDATPGGVADGVVDDPVAPIDARPGFFFGPLTGTGPLGFNFACVSSTQTQSAVTYYVQGDLPPQSTDVQPFAISGPGAIRIHATDFTMQTKAISLKVVDPNGGSTPLQVDASSKYGSLCLDVTTVGTYELHVLNSETSQTARDLYIKFDASDFGPCPNPFTCQ